MEPSDDYIPQITRPKPAWITTNRFPDYGPVVEDDLIPSHSIHEPTHPYQKMQYTKPFPNPDSTSKIAKEKYEFDPVEEDPHRSKPPIVSSQREPLHMFDIFDHQDITEREWGPLLRFTARSHFRRLLLTQRCLRKISIFL